jgi:excisionase family DNA binding protein
MHLRFSKVLQGQFHDTGPGLTYVHIPRPRTLLPKILFRKVFSDTRYTSDMPKPKNPLPTLREKLASFDGAIGADDIARLLQTSRHTVYLWVRDNRIPHFRLNGSLKFDPALIADWIDSTSSTPEKPAPSEMMRPASSPSSRSKTPEQYAQLRPS